MHAVWPMLLARRMIALLCCCWRAAASSWAADDDDALVVWLLCCAVLCYVAAIHFAACMRACVPRSPVPSIRQYLAEMNRVLKDGGLFIVLSLHATSALAKHMYVCLCARVCVYARANDVCVCVRSQVTVLTLLLKAGGRYNAPPASRACRAGGTHTASWLRVRRAVCAAAVAMTDHAVYMAV